MGCVASKLEEEEEVVSICRERKRQLKLAVERRYALAEAHWRYYQALYAVAASIKLFVARHSSTPSPFLITFPPLCPSSSPPPTGTVINNPMFLQQRPSQSTHEAIECESCAASTSSSDSSEEEERKEEEVEVEEEEEQQLQQQQQTGERDEQRCGYFYMQMPVMPPPSMPSPQRDFGWDFFNPFDNVRPEVISGYRRSSDEDLRVVREEEGIPELEEEGDREEHEEKVVGVEEKSEEEHENNRGEVVKVEDDNVNSQVEQKKGLTVIDTPEEGRELLEALRDIEDHFYRAYDSGKDVSRMLEANMVQMQSGLEEIKGGF